MTHILLIARRDFTAYLQGYTGWLIVAAVLFIDGVLFQSFAMGDTARYSHEVLESFFEVASGTTMIAGILLTMRSLAEERSTGTDVLLNTAPLSDVQIILGKYLAVMGVMTLLTLLTAYMPALIFVNGKISLSHIAVGYLGLLSLGSGTVAIGLLGSSLFRSQVVAAIISGVIVVAMLLGWYVSGKTDAPFTEIFAYMAFFDKHYTAFMEGRLLTSALVYYGSVTFGFLLLATKVLQGRRYQ